MRDDRTIVCSPALSDWSAPPEMLSGKSAIGHLQSEYSPSGKQRTNKALLMDDAIANKLEQRLGRLHAKQRLVS